MIQKIELQSQTTHRLSPQITRRNNCSSQHQATNFKNNSERTVKWNQLRLRHWRCHLFRELPRERQTRTYRSFSYTHLTIRRRTLQRVETASWRSSTRSARRCSCTIARRRGASTSYSDYWMRRATRRPRKSAKRVTTGPCCTTRATTDTLRCSSSSSATSKRTRIALKF